ncbi:MAG: hypothetical protein ACPGVG_05110 [Mycobacterium sp.]
MEGAVPDDGIGELLVTSRSLAEYRAMFALSEADMRLGVLDCPGGASSATAEINAAGGNAFAVDPVYGRGLTATQLAQLTQADTNRGNAYVRAHSDLYRWTFFADADHHHRSRSQAGHRFARDYAEHPDHYIAAELPHLPFSDKVFDLVLSSHLLFSYADRLTRGFHREAINELVRLARVEVRIFPLVAMGPVSYAPDELLPALHADGITARVVDVDYEFQAGGNQMLVCTPKGPRASRL